MTRAEFRAYLLEMRRLHPVAKRERVQQIRAGAEVSLNAHKGGFVSLTQEIQRRASSPQQTQGQR